MTVSAVSSLEISLVHGKKWVIYVYRSTTVKIVVKRIVCGSNRKPNTEDAGLMKSLNIHSMQERERERERESKQ